MPKILQTSENQAPCVDSLVGQFQALALAPEDLGLESLDHTLLMSQLVLTRQNACRTSKAKKARGPDCGDAWTL